MTSMDAKEVWRRPLRVKGRDAHQPVNAVLALEESVGMGSLHRDGGGFQSGGVSVQPVQQLDL